VFKLVGLSLCQSPAKMAEPIEVLFGMVNWVGSETLLLVVASAAREFISPRADDSASCPVTDPGNHALDRGAHRCHLPNARSVHMRQRWGVTSN